MAPSLSEPAVEQLIAFLTPKNVAVYAQTREECALCILQLVMNRVTDRWRAANVGPHPSCKESAEALQAIVRDSDAAQLAFESRIAEQDVGRILRVIDKVARMPWGRVRDPVPIPHYQVLPQLRGMQWPQHVQEHAEMLRKALDRVCHACGRVGPDAVVVSGQDLGMLRSSMALLEQNIIQAYAAPVYNRPEWRHTDGPLIYQTFDVDMAGENSVDTVPAVRLVELGRSGQATAALKQPLPPKHDLPRSPGTSPTKKKPRDISVTHRKQTPQQSLQNDGAYQFFILAEREQVKNDINQEKKKYSPDITGQELDSLLAELWTRMLPEEKAPFEAESQKWQELDAGATPGAEISGTDIAIQTIARQKSVKGMKRCKTVLNAESIYQSLIARRNVTLADSITKAAAARISHAAPPPPDRLVRAPPSSGPAKQQMAVIPSRLSLPSGNQFVGRSLLQSMPPSLARQQQQPSQHMSNAERVPTHEELLTRIKNLTADMETGARSMASRNYVANDTPSSPDENASPKTGK